MSYRSSYLGIVGLAIFICTVELSLSAVVFAQTNSQDSPKDRRSGVLVEWREIEPGYSVAQVNLANRQAVLPLPVVLGRFSAERFRVEVKKSAAGPISGVKELAVSEHAVGAINGNFFDENGAPLGLVITGGLERNRLQRGGGLFTGIFQLLGSGELSIVNRDQFNAEGVVEAFQGGPLLVLDGRAIPVPGGDTVSRRSAIAVTRSGNFILVASVLRFPGVALNQLQELLLKPELEIISAMNLDGGGSSQLYLEQALNGHEVHLTGGDTVPVVVLVKRR